MQVERKNSQHPPIKRPFSISLFGNIGAALDDDGGGQKDGEL